MNVCDATKLVYGSVFKTDLTSERKQTVVVEDFRISEDERAAASGLFLAYSFYSAGVFFPSYLFRVK